MEVYTIGFTHKSAEQFLGTHQQAPRLALADGLAARIRTGVPVILSLGLTRPWARPGDTVARHWLQVNNIHLQDNAAWTDASGQPADELPF